MPSNVIKKDQPIDVVAWESVKLGSVYISQWIQEQVGDDVVLYGIPRGGMVPAVTIAHHLEDKGVRVRLVPDIYHVLPSELHKLVIVDEICDSGDTFRVLKQLFPMAKTATLFHRIGAKFTADFHAFAINDDRWLQFPWEQSLDKN